MERIAPERVGVFTNANGTQIESYTVDGITIAPESLVVFGNMQEGLLNRAGRTVRAAHALERAAYDFALNPAPQMVVKTNGTNLPKERLQASQRDIPESHIEVSHSAQCRCIARDCRI
jgi:hypothetical protein